MAMLKKNTPLLVDVKTREGTHYQSNHFTEGELNKVVVVVIIIIIIIIIIRD